MSDEQPPTRADLRAAARRAAEEFDGVLTLRRLRALGYDHRAVGREVSAERWRRHGVHTVAVHTGALSEAARRWRAVWEVAEKVALLDGVSALQAAGMTGFTEEVVHVSVPRNARCPRVAGVRVHRVARTPHERLGAGLPRTRVEVAAVRAAHWAVSDRQAALILCLVVQQRLTTGPRLLAAAATVRGRARRALVRQVASDVADGAHSLGELDFGRLCRAHGIRAPLRQVVRTTASGRVYLDVRWAGSRLVVEVDGAGHRVGLAVTDDNLRQNDVVLGDDRVLRIDLVGMRLQEAAFMAQVRRGLATDGGCV